MLQGFGDDKPAKRLRTPEEQRAEIERVEAQRAKNDAEYSRADKFAQAASDLGADQDEKTFKSVLRTLSRAKPTPAKSPK